MEEIDKGNKLIIEGLRILILISKFEYRKSFKLTIDKIMLYDYYMKFPKTMIEKDSKEYSFYEYYAFYHWKPNYKQYIDTIRFLLSKGLIQHKEYITNNNCLITEIGLDLVNNLKNPYKQSLGEYAKFIRKSISNKSDKEVERIILDKYRGELG